MFASDRSITVLFLWGILASCFFSFFATTHAQSSTFVLPNAAGNSNLTFTLSIPANSKDLVFSLLGPASQSWVAVGIGSQMAGSLIFVGYSDSSGKNVTLSPRIASGHFEPSYSSDVDISLLEGSGIVDGSFVLNARCRNCASWKGGSLDFASTAQAWIYAVGPSGSVQSNSASATIQRHGVYGHFALNMVQATASDPATNITAPPPASNATSGSAAVGDPTSQVDRTPAIHASLSLLGFVLLMPVGTVILRLLGSVRWHWLNQLLASALAMVGGAMGIYLSTIYNDMRGFNSAHQIIGIILLAAVAAQVLLGGWHHRVYKREQRATRYGLVHRCLGWLMIVAAVVNGALGLDLASDSNYIAIYAPIAAVIAVVALGLTTFAWYRKKSRAKFGPVPGMDASDSNIHLANRQQQQFSSTKSQGPV